MSNSQMLPEWAPCRAVLLAWPYPGGDWDANYADVIACYWSMLDSISQSAEVWVLLHPSLSMQAFSTEMALKNYLHPVRVKNDVLYDDTWVRDYGPISCSQGYVAFTFNGWGGKYAADADDAVAAQLEDWLLQRPHGIKFVCEGGGLEIDGDGVLLANEECVIDSARNASSSKDRVQEKLRDSIGVREFAWLKGVVLTGDDTDGHVDTIARLGPKNVIVYSGRNSRHHDAVTLNSLHDQVHDLAARWGWKTFELPTPILTSRVDGRVLPATYANFLICNDAVFLPVYGLPEDDLAASVIASALPDHDVRRVNCSALVEQHGSLHCATMQIAHLLGG